MTLPYGGITNLNSNTFITSSEEPILLFIEYLSVDATPFSNGTLGTLTSATDWVSHNANYTVWTFNVKPGLKWSNGQSVTSNDILTSWGPKMYFNGSYDVLGLGPNVAQESALNSSAAQYVLKTPDAMFSDEINEVPVGQVLWPASIINQYGPAYPNLGTNVVSGPFYTSNYTAGDFSMVLLRNPYFTPQPSVCEIDINFVETVSSTTTYLLSGSTDLTPIEAQNAHSILANPNLHILDLQDRAIQTLQYNDTQYPYNMTQFRQALAYGINESDVVQQGWYGYGQTAYDGQGIVSPVSTKWYNPNTMKYSYSPSTAVSLLQQIGITKGSDGLLHYPNGTVVNLKIWTDSDEAGDVLSTSSVANSLTSLGFKVAQSVVSLADIVGDYDANSQGIRDNIILSTFPAMDFGFPLTNNLPGWDVYWQPTIANVHWLYPPSADNEYNGNFSQFTSTKDYTVQKEASFNIQALDAQYLPTIVVSYPDVLWAYSTARWTNWPTDTNPFTMGVSTHISPSALVSLTPVESVVTTTTSASSTAASTSSTATSSTTTPSSSNDTYLILAAVVVIIIVVVAVAFMMRGRGPKATPPTPPKPAS